MRVMMRMGMRMAGMRMASRIMRVSMKMKMRMRAPVCLCWLPRMCMGSFWR